MKYLEFHKICLKIGHMPSDGLCNCLGGNIIDLFKPSSEEFEMLYDSHVSWSYWASGLLLSDSAFDRSYLYTPLRQNIVLFLAAMNGEL